MKNICSRPTSQSSLSTNSSTRSVWSRFSGLIRRRRYSQRRESYHSSTCSSTTPTTTSATPSSSNNSDIDLTSSSGSIRSASKPKRYSTPVQLRQHRQQDESLPPFFAIPPYSPTYCKDNEFPYSNFYVRLPNGDYMVRYRSGNRDILGTEIIAGYMIWSLSLHPNSFLHLVHL